MLLGRDDIGQTGAGDFILVFDHLPKCAGTSVVRTLTPCFDPDSVLALNNFEYHKLRDIEKYRFISGNEVYGVHTVAPDIRFSYFTFLRDPLSSAVSLYNYVQTTMIKKFCLEEYITQYYPHNRFFTQLGRGSMDFALGKIEEYFFVGIVESFDRCMAELTHKLGLPPKNKDAFTATNVSRKSIAFPEALKDYFMEQNKLDYEIYEAAVERVRRSGIVEENGPIQTPVYTEVLSCEVNSDTYASDRIKFEKTIDNMPLDMSMYDCEALLDSAIEFIDCEAARKVHAASRSICGNYLFERYVQFLVITCKGYAEARDLLDEVLEASDGITASDGYVANYFYRIRLLRCVCGCELGEAGDWRGEAARLVDAMIELPPRIRTHPLLVKVCSMLGFHAVLRRFHERMLSMELPDREGRVALEATSVYFYSVKDYETAAAGIRKLVELDGYMLSYLQAAQVLYRHGVKECDATQGLVRLAELLPDCISRTTVQRELAVSGVSLESAGTDAADEESVDDRLLREISGNHRLVNFRDIQAGEAILCICSGPDVMLKHLNEVLFSGYEGTVDYILKERVGTVVQGNKNTGKICFFPGNVFDYTRDAPELLSGLAGHRYDKVVLFMASYGFSPYVELLRFSRELGGEVLFYMFSQLATKPFHDSFFRLEDVGS